MSTNKKKLYTFKDIERAEADISAVKKYFDRKSQRRKTIQVRVGDRWHKKLKETATFEKRTISSFLDQVCKYFFSNY